jgi:hypothetical protein
MEPGILTLTWQEIFVLGVAKDPASIADVTKAYNLRAQEFPIMETISHETVRRTLMKLRAMHAIDEQNKRTDVGLSILTGVVEKHGSDAAQWPSTLEIEHFGIVQN